MLSGCNQHLMPSFLHTCALRTRINITFALLGRILLPSRRRRRRKRKKKKEKGEEKKKEKEPWIAAVDLPKMGCVNSRESRQAELRSREIDAELRRGEEIMRYKILLLGMKSVVLRRHGRCAVNCMLPGRVRI